MKLYKEVDLAIIGAGIVGTTVAALSAIRNPQRTLALLDKNLIGKGATLYSAGVSTPLAKSEFSQNLINRTSHVINELKEKIPLKIDKKNCAFLLTSSKVDVFYQQYKGSDLERIPSSFFNETTLHRLMTIPEDTQIFFSKELSHVANPSGLVETMALFLRERYCSIFESCSVNNVVETGGRVLLECDNNLVINAKKVIFALGPWGGSNLLCNESAEKKTNLRNKKITALHLNFAPNENDPIVVFYDDDAFLLPLNERGHWLFSFTSKDWDYIPDDKMSISSNDLILAQKILQKYGLHLADYFSGGRVFCDSYSGNKEFSLWQESKNIIMISGASGSGYRFSYGIADKILASF